MFLRTDQPSRIERIAVEGQNCLFRALSSAVFGDQDEHKLMREKVIDYLSTNIFNKTCHCYYHCMHTLQVVEFVNKNEDVFYDRAERRSRKDDDPPGSGWQLHSVTMANEGEWGTDIEIEAAATLLNTPIAVFNVSGCNFII
jgi:hypothetical protein